MSVPAKQFDIRDPIPLNLYIVGDLPSASEHSGAVIFVENESSGPVPAFSDGTDWRRVTDRAVVS